ncbi:protein LONGIFOLIA 1 isoform X2 [Cryptomeria japonica]|uniref:protein LONGIFOLIA 1 isoform X2 n=1 Tax=Cryptomeria japonica TaxID=3369 RepID=UPI0027DA0ADF|nr:protein LONGIFOLIA 1 isoform X2 [Cryptomeria japonica]
MEENKLKAGKTYMSYSGKFLYLVPDDPPTRMGCMTGILHLFDRHHFRNLHGNRRITAGRLPGLEPVENDDDPRSSIDSSKLPKRMLAFRSAEVVMDEESRRSESEFPYRLSPGLRNRSHRRTQSTESLQIPWQSEDDSMGSPRAFTARSRFSCDGRDIPRPPPAVDHRDAYRSSSLRTMEFPRLSVGVMDSPARRPSNIVAKLMGLGEMPDPPLQARKATDPAPTKPSAPPSPRPLAAKILLDMIHQPISLSQPKHKSESVNHAQDQNNNPSRLECSGEDSNLCSTAKIPTAQGAQNSLLDAEVKEALDKPREAVKSNTCSDPKLPAIKMKPVEKFGSSAPVTNESGGFSSRSSGRAPQKTKKFGDDVSSKRSKPIANKMPEEVSNAASTHKPSPRNRSEISPPRSPKDDPKERRKKKAMEIRPEKTNFKRDEYSPAARLNSDSKFSMQSPKAKRGLDFSPKSRQVNSKGTNQACKAEQKTDAKPCEKEFVSHWQPEEPNLMHSTETILQKSTTKPCEKELLSDWQSEEPNFMHSTENILQKPCEKEFISNLQSEEPNLMHSTENILQKTTAKPCEKDLVSDWHSEEPDLMDSSESILQKPKPRDSFHYTHKSWSNDLKVRDFVTELFTACGLLKEGKEEKDISMDLYFPGNFSMDSEIFHELEKKYINVEEADAQRLNRRLLFDTVNEVLRRKSAVPPYSRLPQRGRGCRSSKLSGHDIVNSVVMEIESLTSLKWQNIFSGVTKLLDKDLETSFSNDAEAMEVSEVALVVERGIFRDLMDDLLRDLLF